MSQRARALAAAAAGVLLLALATGALRSPFLLLLPLPLFALSLALEPKAGHAALLVAAGVLLLGEALLESLRSWEAATAMAALALLGAAAAAVRRWLRDGTLEERAEIRLPTATARSPANPEAEELARQLLQIRAWSRADGVVLWEAGPERARAVAAAGRAPPPPFSVDGDPLGWLAREGTPLRLERRPPWAADGAEVIAVRTWAEGDVAWLLTYEYLAGRTLPAWEELALHGGPLRSLLGALSAQREARAWQQRLDGLLALLRRIPVEIELGAYGRELLQAALALTGGTGGCVGTWSGEAGEVFARVGGDGGPLPGAAFAPPHSELALAVRAGAPIVRAPGSWRPGQTQVANSGDEWLARPRTLAAIPLLTPSGAVGAMALWSTHSASFDARTLDLLGAVLPYAALHLDHALEYGRLRERADRDVLTGLRNRRAFEAAFLTERLRFERYGRPIAVLMVDIDHFKGINDAFGHETGDDVLRTVARVLDSAIRDVDVPARFGGEEFVVLLPETTLAPAADVAERVRAAVEQTSFTATGRPLAVRVSIGVSACPEQVATPQALLGSADAALYEAKRAGRNQVRLAPPPARPGASG